MPLVKITENDTVAGLDIFIDDQHFTTYLFTDSLKKPVLFPVYSPAGKQVTRGFPVMPRPGERVDHPHHLGIWFNYGNVNGLDFWNNSYLVQEEKQANFGKIAHQSVETAASGDTGLLVVTTKWLAADGTALLHERTSFYISATGSRYFVDRSTTLQALADSVLFKDNKEGLLGMRVARELEFATEEPVILTGKDGLPAETPVVDNHLVTGNYLNSNGQTGGSVWGQRAKWCQLAGVIEGDSTSITIIDHPQNPGYPAYWHARPYGLFAANPLGQKVFSDGKEILNFALKATEQATFRYRIVVGSGKAPSAAEIVHMASSFQQAY